MKLDRYRVYPNVEGMRARSFVHLEPARTFAELAYSKQDILDTRPVSVIFGYGSNFVEVGASLHARLKVPEHLARCWVTPRGDYLRVVVQRLSDGKSASGKAVRS